MFGFDNCCMPDNIDAENDDAVFAAIEAVEAERARRGSDSMRLDLETLWQIAIEPKMAGLICRRWFRWR